MFLTIPPSFQEAHIESIRDVPYDGLVRTSEKIYDLLTLGKSFDQTVDGETKGFTPASPRAEQK